MIKIYKFYKYHSHSKQGTISKSSSFSQSYNEQERYLTNPSTNRNPESTENGSNCASLVSSILQYSGATWEQILESADTNGIDVGERHLIPIKRFNP